MPISVTCECGSEFLTRDDNAGRRAMCPDCGREMTVPTPTPSPPRDDVLVISEAAPAAAPVTSRKAVASLTFGLFFFCLAFAGIPAIVLGCDALGEIRRGQGRIKGRAKAWAGILLGIFSTLLTVAMLLPAYRSAHEAARRARCVNNLKQIGLALHNYHDTYNVFPAAAITDPQGRPLLSWRVAILPFLEQAALYNKFHLDEPWNSPHNLTLVNEWPNLYACPSDPNIAPDQTNYQVIIDPPVDVHPRFLAHDDRRSDRRHLEYPARGRDPPLCPLDRARRPTLQRLDPPIRPRQPPQPPPRRLQRPLRRRLGQVLKPTIAPATFEAIVTRNGGEVVSSDSF